MPFFDPLLQALQSASYIVLGLFGIGFLIGFHELGHFLFCKLFSVRTPSFSIGFGPKLISRKIWDTEFVISPIPLGGFVEIAGAAEVGQGEQKESSARDKGSFAVKPYYQKLLVMCGGIAFNLLFAYCAFILLNLTGIPKTPFLYPSNTKTTIENLETGSSADLAGLRIGDSIRTFDNVTVLNDTPTLIKLIQQSPDKAAVLGIDRDGSPLSIPVTIGSRDVGGKKVGSLGITEFTMEALPGAPLGTALERGIAMTNEWITRTIQGFSSIFTGGNFSNLGGPLMVVSLTVKGATAGFKIFLLWLAIISINLAILNLIPLPILDGGQLLFYTIEAIMGRPLPIKVREYIHIASWIFMLILIIFLSVNDISRMASPYIENIKQFLGFGR